MRTRIAVLPVLAVAAASVLVPGVARADDTGPAVTALSYAAYANASDTVSATVTDSSSTVSSVQVSVGSTADNLVTVSLPATQTSPGVFTATGPVSLSSFADGTSLDVYADATDAAGKDAADDDNDYTDDSRPIVVDRTPPVVTLGQPSATPGGLLTVPFTASDNQPGVTATCSVNGGSLVTNCLHQAYFPSAPVGRDDVRVTATDQAGNTTAADAVTTVTQTARLTASIDQSVLNGGSTTLVHVVASGRPNGGVSPTGSIHLTVNGAPVADGVLGTTGPTTSAADIPIPVVGGSHLVLATYTGDSLSAPATFAASYTALPLNPAKVKLSKSSGGKLTLTVSCPTGSARCLGTLSLGKSKTTYAVYGGRSGVAKLALPAAVVAKVKKHQRVPVSVTVADAAKRSTLKLLLR